MEKIYEESVQNQIINSKEKTKTKGEILLKLTIFEQQLKIVKNEVNSIKRNDSFRENLNDEIEELMILFKKMEIFEGSK